MCGHRIKKVGLHIDSHDNNVYVLDLEDDESSMQDQASAKDLPAQEPPVLAVNEDFAKYFVNYIVVNFVTRNGMLI